MPHLAIEIGLAEKEFRPRLHAHGSDSLEAAVREIGIYFTDDELIPHEPTLAHWLTAADER